MGCKESLKVTEPSNHGTTLVGRVLTDRRMMGSQHGWVGRDPKPPQADPCHGWVPPSSSGPRPQPWPPPGMGHPQLWAAAPGPYCPLSKELEFKTDPPHPTTAIQPCQKSLSTFLTSSLSVSPQLCTTLCLSSPRDPATAPPLCPRSLRARRPSRQPSASSPCSLSRLCPSLPKSCWRTRSLPRLTTACL